MVRFGFKLQFSHSMRHIIVLLAAFVLSVSSRVLAQSTPDPSPDEYIEVSGEPHETIPLEKLIVYPESARRSGLEGRVALQALVGKDGSVEKVNVLRSDDNVFEDAAIDAIQREKYTPAMQNGTPVKVWITRTINFKLGPDERPLNNIQNEGSSNFRQSESRPHFNFRNLVGLNLDSARGFFRMFGDVGETKEADGIHLHAENTQARISRVADGIVGDSGLAQITVVYRSQNDTDFVRSAATWNARGILGGKLVSQTAVTELPNALATVATDAKERTVRVVLQAK